MLLPKIIAHRGASGYAPENTMAAIMDAVQKGAKAIEFDVNVSADGIPILLHDETLDRTTNGSGPVVEKTFAELEQLDAGSWFSPNFSGISIPSLSDVLNGVFQSDLALNLELKPTPGWEQETVRAVVQALKKNMSPVLVSSFNVEALKLFHEQMPDHPIALISKRVPENAVLILQTLGCNAIHCKSIHLQKKDVERLVNAGFIVRAYTTGLFGSF